MATIKNKAHASIIKYIFIFLIPFANAESIYDLASGRNIYLKIKHDSNDSNKEVFRKYESQKTKKIIAICYQSSVTYTVAARWDMSISSKEEAENEAYLLCEESGAISGKLIGYKIKKEIRF